MPASPWREKGGSFDCARPGGLAPLPGLLACPRSEAEWGPCVLQGRPGQAGCVSPAKIIRGGPRQNMRGRRPPTQMAVGGVLCHRVNPAIPAWSSVSHKPWRPPLNPAAARLRLRLDPHSRTIPLPRHPERSEAKSKDGGGVRGGGVMFDEINVSLSERVASSIQRLQIPISYTRYRLSGFTPNPRSALFILTLSSST